jgi:hypothetical protein
MPRNSLTDLLAQKLHWTRRLPKCSSPPSDAIDKVKAMMAEYGLTAADLGAPLAVLPTLRPGLGVAAATASKPASSAQPGSPGDSSTSAAQRRKPSATQEEWPKYRNPGNRRHVDGPSLKPKWLVAALNSVARCHEFAL